MNLRTPHRPVVAMMALVSLTVFSCVSAVYPRQNSGAPRTDGIRVSFEDATKESRGTLMVITFCDGSSVDGRYRGPGSPAGGSILIKEWDGSVRQVLREEVAAVEVFHDNAGLEVAGALGFVAIVGLGFLALRSNGFLGF